MKTVFTKLNDNWNAEPNAPYPEATWSDEDLLLRFCMNPYQFPQFEEDDIGIIRFVDCARFRIGTVNDEGWYRGQCRFSKLAPKWGEFYEITGDLCLDQIPNDWIYRVQDWSERRHFLFYFRDEEFECDARDWSLGIKKPNKAVNSQAQGAALGNQSPAQRKP